MMHRRIHGRCCIRKSSQRATSKNRNQGLSNTSRTRKGGHRRSTKPRNHQPTKNNQQENRPTHRSNQSNNRQPRVSQIRPQKRSKARILNLQNRARKESAPMLQMSKNLSLSHRMQKPSPSLSKVLRSTHSQRLRGR